MTMIFRPSIVLGSLALAILATGPAAAADSWVIRRVATNGSCSVSKSTASPIGSQIGGSYASPKEACTAVGKLFDDKNPADTAKCYSYARGAVELCKKEGVTLSSK